MKGELVTFGTGPTRSHSKVLDYVLLQSFFSLVLAYVYFMVRFEQDQKDICPLPFTTIHFFPEIKSNGLATVESSYAQSF